jgi:hypothetical protein
VSAKIPYFWRRVYGVWCGHSTLHSLDALWNCLRRLLDARASVDAQGSRGSALQDGMCPGHFLGRAIGDDQMFALPQPFFVVQNVFLSNPPVGQGTQSAAGSSARQGTLHASKQERG